MKQPGGRRTKHNKPDKRYRSNREGEMQFANARVETSDRRVEHSSPSPFIRGKSFESRSDKYPNRGSRGRVVKKNFHRWKGRGINASSLLLLQERRGRRTDDTRLQEERRGRILFPRAIIPNPVRFRLSFSARLVPLKGTRQMSKRRDSLFVPAKIGEGNVEFPSPFEYQSLSLSLAVEHIRTKHGLIRAGRS